MVIVPFAILFIILVEVELLNGVDQFVGIVWVGCITVLLQFIGRLPVVFGLLDPTEAIVIVGRPPHNQVGVGFDRVIPTVIDLEVLLDLLVLAVDVLGRIHPHPVVLGVGLDTEKVVILVGPSSTRSRPGQW